MNTPERAIRATRDAYVGLDNPTWEEWEVWHRAMLHERQSVLACSKLDLALYADPDSAWSDTTFRQLLLFMYDVSFYDRESDRYRTAELIEDWTAMYGRVDSVLLWHAYPRIGFDSRTQFHFYRDMPGGIARLKSEVTDVFRAHGIRVFVDYNPWCRTLERSERADPNEVRCRTLERSERADPNDSNPGMYEELGELVLALDADGVMLDTMTDVPERLARAVDRRRRGVVFAPELRPNDADLSHVRQSWAQWFDVGDAGTPSIYRHRWLVPQHRQLAIRRWDTSRKHDIVYSFFNGSGLILWDNIFGTWNPYSREDRRLIAETAAIIDRYHDLFVHGEWRPLIPTGVPGLDANCWTTPRRTIVTLRNRTTARLHYRVPTNAPAGLTCVAFWGDNRELSSGDTVIVEPEGVQALVVDDPAQARQAVAHFHDLSERADVTLPAYEERRPRPRPIRGAIDERRPAGAGRARTPVAPMIEIPAGTFEMHIRHDRRECGCYPFGANDEAMWGWFYKDIVTHDFREMMKPFAMRIAAVTNADFLEFVNEAGYRPKDRQRFLSHLVNDGSLPTRVPSALESLPVTFVSLADARAYAAWHGQRLPTEAEWQWAAEGAGAGNRYPWGNDERRTPGEIQPAVDPRTATPQGVMGLSGNAWELTESEYTDGHTRFVMLRGGCFLPPGGSEWLPLRGVRPNDSHAKYVLLTDGLDRSETISFRTVIDRKTAS
jgi:iron(II)-dependent oxidoreductase